MFTALIRAGRIEACDKVEVGEALSGSNICVVPRSGSTLEVGDIVMVHADMSKRDDCTIPVIVGQFSEGIFNKVLDIADLSGTQLDPQADFFIYAGELFVD